MTGSLILSVIRLIDLGQQAAHSNDDTLNNTLYSTFNRSNSVRAVVEITSKKSNMFSLSICQQIFQRIYRNHQPTFLHADSGQLSYPFLFFFSLWPLTVSFVALIFFLSPDLVQLGVLLNFFSPCLGSLTFWLKRPFYPGSCKKKAKVVINNSYYTHYKLRIIFNTQKQSYT